MNQVLKKSLNGSVVVIAILLLVYAAWSWIASIRLNLVWRDQAKQGLPMSTKEMMPKPGAVDDNAAQVLNRAFSSMARGAVETEPYNAAIRELLNYVIIEADTEADAAGDPRHLEAPKKAALRTLFASAPVEQTLALLEEASLRHECNFGINYSQGAATLLPHLAHLRNAVRLLTLRAWLRTEADDPGGALRDVRTALRLANFLKCEPVLISQLVRISCNHMALQTLQAILSEAQPTEFPDTDLQALITQIEIQPDTDNSKLVAAIDGERILLGNWCFQRLVRGEMGSKELEAMGMPSSLRFYYNPIGRPWVKTDFRLYLVTMGKYREMAPKPFYEMARQPAPGEAIPKYFALTRLILPALDSVYRQAAGEQAEIALAHIGLLITQHVKASGHVPSDLGELAVPGDFPRDPFSGKQFVYLQAGQGYVLYSLGPDLEDNQGDPFDKQSKRGDLVWRVTK